VKNVFIPLLKPRTTSCGTLSIARWGGAGRRVGRKTASMIYENAVETPHFVRRDVKRINVRTIICCVGAQIQDVLGLFRLLPKFLMTDLGLIILCVFLRVLRVLRVQREINYLRPCTPGAGNNRLC
jgi:hypothetical protein